MTCLIKKSMSRQNIIQQSAVNMSVSIMVHRMRQYIFCGKRITRDSGLLQRNITILAEMRLHRRQMESTRMTWKSSWKESMLNRSLSIRQQHPLSQSLRNEDLRLRKQRMMYLMVFDLSEIC